MNITDILSVVSVVIAIIYDLFAWYYWGVEKTITVTVQKYSKKWPLLPFLIGMLIGHWFW